MGTGSVIRPGEVQRMSAGTGVTHSEQNASTTDPVHLLQIWILPEKKGITPSYEQTKFETPELEGRLTLVGSNNPSGHAVTIRQDVQLYAGILRPGQSATHSFAPGR